MLAREQSVVGDLVDRGSVRSVGVMTDAESDGPQSQRTIRMGHSDEDSTEAAIRPRDVGLDAAAEPGAVAAFGLAGHQAGLRKPAKAAQILVKRAQCLFGACRQTREVFLQGVVVKADREDRLGLRFDHPQPSSSVGSDPNWRSNSCGSSRCSP